MKINGKEIKGLKKAVGDFNNWSGYADLVFNTKTGNLTTFEYNGGEKPEYLPEVKILVTKAEYSMWERDKKTSMKEIRSLCERSKS